MTTRVELRSRNLPLCAALTCALVWTGCGDDDDDAAVRDGGDRDAGKSDGGKNPSASGQVGAKATFTLAPVVADDDAGEDTRVLPQQPINGTGTFRVTTVRIDLSIDFSGCRAYAAYPMRLLEGSDCESALARGKVMTDSDDITVATCRNGTGKGRVRYARPLDAEPLWSIGASAATDLPGHVIVLYDADTKNPLACGAITRVAGTPAPDPNANADAGVHLRIETMATLSGACLGKAPGRTSPEPCPVAEDLVTCARTHCDPDACVRRCPDYAQCVENAEDQCVPLCPPTSAECSQCWNDELDCALTFCAPLLACADPPEPGGACDMLRECCESQAMEGFRATCMNAVELLIPLVGDLGCENAMRDVGFTENLHKSDKCPWGTKPDSEP